MSKRPKARRAARTAEAVRERLSYANVMATAAVFIALGGTAWAVAANSVGTRQLKNNAVKTKKIANGAVKTAKIANNAVTAPKLACSGNSAEDVMVRVGSVCIDRYENSLWTQPNGGQQITGAIPCNENGQNCDNIYARSVAGVEPRRFITWFQAQQALANSGKRLPTNAEWQTAVAGTPDGAPCNVSSGSVANTGAAAGCRSDWGANDMVGNLWEWVADWVPQSDAPACPGWETAGEFSSDDQMCLTGASTTAQGPGALIRGGAFSDGTDAGPLAIDGFNRPQFSPSTFGFRGAR